MKKPLKGEMPLKDDPKTWENKREKLAELIGMLLARYWLKRQTQTKEDHSDPQTSQNDSSSGLK